MTSAPATSRHGIGPAHRRDRERCGVAAPGVPTAISGTPLTDAISYLWQQPKWWPRQQNERQRRAAFNGQLALPAACA